MKELTSKEMGKKGGNTTKRKYGVDHYRKIGKKGGSVSKKTKSSMNTSLLPKNAPKAQIQPHTRSKTDIARQEAIKLMKKTKGECRVLRSCWKCNAGHKHLKDDDTIVISCFECGHHFYKGIDITN